MQYKYLVISIILVLINTSCATKHSEIILSDFNVDKVKMAEFESNYAKNSGGYETAKADSIDKYENFLDLYTVYRMKLRDAFVRGYYNDEDLNNELNDYKQKVGVSYVEEKNIVSPGMQRFYDQRGEEVRVSHIMVRIDTSQSDAEAKAQAILDSIKNGAGFEDMAVKHSDDKFSKNQGGDIYWFTAGQIIAPFEVAAYNCPIGEVYPEVVKTKFGYHIVKVTNRQKRKYKIRASHILIKTERDGEVDSNYARNIVTRLVEMLENDAPFDSLAMKHSEDNSNASKGGDLGYFERRQMVQPFDEAVFNLEIGEISRVVKTRFGFHIIKLTDIKEYPPFEGEIENIRDIYKKSRYQYDYDQYINKITTEFNLTVNEKIVEQFFSADSIMEWTNDYKENDTFKKLKNEEIIKYNKTSKNVDSLFAFMIRQNKNQNKAFTKDILNTAIKGYSEELLLSAKAGQLADTNPEFAQLMNDYRNGIYIFKLQEDEVWNKIKIDSTKLRKLYEETKDNYKTKDQIGFSEIYSYNKKESDSVYTLLENGANFDSLATVFTKRSAYKNKAGNYGLKDISDEELVKKANSLKSVGKYSEVFRVKNGYSIVRLNGRESSRIKTYEEALPEVSSAFQEMESNRLETEYNNKLKEFYNPKYFYDELVNAFETENN